jgi:hypothetical protein
MKVTKKTVKTVTETTTYQIHPNVEVVDVVMNGGPKNRQMIKAGKTIKDGDYKIDFWTIYDPDLKYLEKTNPFWYHDKVADQKWFEGNPIPDDPKDIDVSKIVFMSGYDHSFWTVELEPIPVVIQGDYIDAQINSSCYALDRLYDYFSKHKQVKSITPIELVPYYNNESGYETWFKVLVLPTVKQLKELKADKKRKTDLFYKPWNDTDYLGMKKFYIRKEEH